MAKMVVIYKPPADPAAFTRHYFETHVPLAKKLPGLRKYEVSQGPIAMPAGGAGAHFVATLHFDDMASIRAAFATPEGQAAMQGTALETWLTRMTARPSMQATLPPELLRRRAA